MNRLKVYFLSLIVVIGFFACSDDGDSFGALGFEGPTALTVEVHRDTADKYKISLPVTSEKGLAKISLVENATTKVLDEKTSFTNPNVFTYEYNYDLSAYSSNSAIMLTLNIEDVDKQVVKQNITINVKKFSELDIRFAFEGKIISLFEDCNLKLTVVRGMIPLKEVQVFVGNSPNPEKYDLSLDPEQAKYDLNLSVKDLELGDNSIKVVVVDAKNQLFDRTTIIRRELAKGWKDLNRLATTTLSRIMINDNVFGYFGVPDENHLYRLSLGMSPDYESGYYLEFEYNGEKVSKMQFSTYKDDWDLGVMLIDWLTYTYEYNANDELVKVTKKTSNTNAVDYVTDVVYEAGNIKSYKLEGKLINTNYIEKDGEMIRVDYLDDNMSGYTYGLKNRNSNNPMYMSGLPAVVPGAFNGFQLNVLYNRYFFDTLNDGTTEKIAYTIGSIVDEGWANTQTITWEENAKAQKIVYTYIK